MAVTNVNGVTVNKITKAQYDAEKLAGNITAAMEQNEVWLFTDDQHVSSTEKENWNAKSEFSGSYNDLTDKPTIPTVPTNVSSFTNDAGYLTEVEYDDLIGKPELFSGSYNDLTDKPSIPDVSGFETKTDATAKLTEAKAYTDTKVADLVGTAPTTLDTLQEVAAAIQENESVVEALNSAIGNKANASDIPTKVSDLTNDIGYLTSVPGEYITETELNNKGYLTSFTESDPTVPSHVKAITEENISNWNAKSEFSGSYDDLTNKPDLFSGSYNDLTDKPTIPTAITKIWE